MLKKFFLIIVIATASLLIADETDPNIKTFSENDVDITVEKIEDDLKGFKKFKVTAKNNAEAQKTLNAKIFLSNNTQKMPKGGAGECTVYIEIPAGEEKIEEKQCKETKASNDWVFEIVKVYNF